MCPTLRHHDLAGLGLVDDAVHLRSSILPHPLQLLQGLFDGLGLAGLIALNAALQPLLVGDGVEGVNAQIQGQPLLTHWRELRFSPAVAAGNPKRRQREIRREPERSTAVETKAQQALQAQREELNKD